MSTALVVAAAGKGTRLRSKTPKPFVSVLGKPLFIRTLERVAGSFRFQEIVVAADPDQLDRVRHLLVRYHIQARVVAGGKTRAESVRNAVHSLPASVRWVAIHDAARPFVSARLVRNVLAAARMTGAAICGLAPTATVKKVSKAGRVLRTEDRQELVLVQTPQVFDLGKLRDRYQALGDKALGCTDEAALFDGSRTQVVCVPGEPFNIKITTPEDRRLMTFLIGEKL